MYKVYVKDENGLSIRVEEFERYEECQSKLDKWLREGYREVMVVTDDFKYIIGKIEEYGKVLKKKKK